ncbi:MAG TPA: response regulator transcription factor [Jatrophihabitans sp.]|nr:response regulator transcription factor [Jatrophihabitans sp.]
MARVLVVEDDPTVSEVVLSYLARAGHQAEAEQDGAGAARRLTAADPVCDLVVLDLMLPNLDGIEVCRRLRRHHAALPVIMLTALGQEDDRIAGLEIGADDYLTKPFSPRELLLRVESLLRRAQPPSVGVPRLLQRGPITLDVAGRRVFKHDRELSLTARELDLLGFLMANPGTAYTRAELMSAVWGWSFGDQSTVTVHVRRVREKIEDDPKKPELIQTVWGVGYRMDAS